MKNKIWILILVTSIFATAGYGQRFKGGIHAGLLATQVDGDEMSGYRKPGLFFGVFANVPFDEYKIKLQLEIDYAQKGSKSRASDIYRYKISLHQIEVPVTVGWNIWKEFSIEGGISCNIIANAREYTNGILVPRDAGGSKFYLFELGAVGGINYCIKERLGLFFRMNYSLSPIGKSTVPRGGKKLERYMCNNDMLFGISFTF